MGNKGGLEIKVDIHPDKHGLANGKIIPLGHLPSWKIGKNTFSPSILNKQQGSIAPLPPPPTTTNEYGRSDYLSGTSSVREPIYVYDSHQDVQGVVHLILPHGKSFEHLGIKIQFLGRIKMVSFLLLHVWECTVSRTNLNRLLEY